VQVQGIVIAANKKDMSEFMDCLGMGKGMMKGNGLMIDYVSVKEKSRRYLKNVKVISNIVDNELYLVIQGELQHGRVVMDVVVEGWEKGKRRSLRQEEGPGC
jgi:hypothetical protein